MNQDHVKKILVDIVPAEKEFTIVFSGKTSKTVNGLYKPETAEIVIHNRNFESDNALVYTAIHEYAHHIHACRKAGVPVGKAHSNEFWAVFEELLGIAESKGHYRNIFELEPSFVELTHKIKGCCIEENGKIMLQFGQLMVEAQKLCESHKMRFEDYVDRTLGVPRSTASAAVRAARYSIDPSIGWDGMKMAAGIKDEGKRIKVVESLKSGSSPAAVKAEYSTKPPSSDPARRLLDERERIRKIIANLSGKLKTIEDKLAEIDPQNSSGITEPSIDTALPLNSGNSEQQTRIQPIENTSSTQKTGAGAEARATSPRTDRVKPLNTTEDLEYETEMLGTSEPF